LPIHFFLLRNGINDSRSGDDRRIVCDDADGEDGLSVVAARVGHAQGEAGGKSRTGSDYVRGDFAGIINRNVRDGHAVNEAGGSSLSLTVAICELEVAAPCLRVTPDAAVIVGGFVSQLGKKAIASKLLIVWP